MSSDLPSADPSATAEAGAPLLEALERHSASARDHADSTATYAFATAAELGLDRRECELVREAARLHEVGLVYASPPGELGTHQAETYSLAHGAAIDEEVCGWLLRARERYDGAGPEGLAAEAIPLASRVIRAACTFHATLAESPGSAHAGAERIGSQAGAELDPRVVVALVTVVERAAT